MSAQAKICKFTLTGDVLFPLLDWLLLLLGSQFGTEALDFQQTTIFDIPCTARLWVRCPVVSCIRTKKKPRTIRYVDVGQNTK